MSKVDVVEILKKSDALLEGHFLLSSGKHSNRYVQCAKVLRFPKYAEQVLSTVVDQIKDLDIDLVVGPAMGGVIVSYELGRQLNKETVFTERKDGVMELRRGFEVKPGAKIIIAEDVVTTGKSTIETKEALEKLGGEVIGIAFLIELEELNGRKLLENYDTVMGAIIKAKPAAAKGQYMNFLPYILELLSDDGILVTDNVLQEGSIADSKFSIPRRERTIHMRMREYLFTLTHSKDLKTVVLAVGDGMTLTVKQSL